MLFKFMTKTAKRKLRKGKKVPTIAMMTKNPGKGSQASRGKWGQGAYRNGQINRMMRAGFTEYKAKRIADINAGL